MGNFLRQTVWPESSGGTALPAYRHYRLDGAGRISKAEWFEASDDADAIRQVKERKLSIASEIWQGNRRVGEIQPSDS
jgi:hypothetical protein